MNTSKELISVIMANIRELDFIQGKKPHIQCRSIGDDGRVLSIRSRGTDITQRFLRDNEIILNVTGQAIGAGGITTYDDEVNPGLGFTARFSGEVCSVFVPLSCIIGVFYKDGNAFVPVAMISSNATSVDLFTLMHIAQFLSNKDKFMTIEYMELPSSEKKRTCIDGSNFGLSLVDENGASHYEFRINDVVYYFNIARDGTLAANGSSIPERENIVITSLFTPVNELARPYAVIHQGELGIGDEGLRLALEAVIGPFNPEPKDHSDRAPTEKTSGNVVAVNFGSKEIVR